MIDPSSKELIAFSGDGNGITRASMTRGGFTSSTKVVVRIKADATSQTTRYTQAVLTAAAETTSDTHNTEYGLEGAHSDLSYVSGWERYWDDAFGRDSKLTVYAVAVPNNTTTISNTFLDQTGGTVINSSTNPNWYTIDTENTKVSWSVSAKQTADTRLVEDLAYSNNIKEGESTYKGRYTQTYTAGTDTWTKGMGFGRLQWEAQASGSTTGKFDQGHLVFKHALSWITLVFKEGDGFDNNSTSDFTWTNKPTDCAQTVTLTTFPTSGSLDVSTGEWSGTTSAAITQMAETTANEGGKTTRSLDAYVLPGTNLYTTTDNVLEFEIDNAKYYVTGKQIAEAVRKYYSEGGAGASSTNASTYKNFTTTEAGKHYFINLTIAKKAISNVTAAILDWETVNSADADADNTYCTFDFEDRNTRLVEANAAQFNIYRAAKTFTDFITSTETKDYTWETGYTTDGAATKTWVTETDNNHWSTNWFWPDNKTCYHFRAAGKGTSATSVDNSVTFNSGTPDNFTITSGTISGSTYKDYLWGAPFTFVDNTYELNYDNTNGFAKIKDGTTYQITPAIAATKSQIKMLLFHMTSQVFVNLRTTTGDDKVSLKDDSKDLNIAKVEILNFLPNGTVNMGNGLVTATDGTRTTAATMTNGTYTAADTSNPDRVENYSFGIVPQDLTWGSGETAGTIGLRITTPDGNQYVVKDLSTCTGTVTTTNLLNPYTLDSGTSYKITKWYPHYQYTYTITIKQTGISNITAAVLPWETVTGDLGTIDLEN